MKLFQNGGSPEGSRIKEISHLLRCKWLISNVGHLGIKLFSRYPLIINYLRSAFYRCVTELDTDSCKKPLFNLFIELFICNTKVILLLG